MSGRKSPVTKMGKYIYMDFKFETAFQVGCGSKQTVKKIFLLIFVSVILATGMR